MCFLCVSFIVQIQHYILGFASRILGVLSTETSQERRADAGVLSNQAKWELLGPQEHSKASGGSIRGQELPPRARSSRLQPGKAVTGWPSYLIPGPRQTARGTSPLCQARQSISHRAAGLKKNKTPISRDDDDKSKPPDPSTFRRQLILRKMSIAIIR